MRFIYVTDLHIRGRAPGRRTDSWPDVPLRKVEFVCRLAKERGADFVLCGGDLFDVPRPGYGVVGEFLHIVRSVGVPWKLVVGNHDIIGHQADSWRSGAVGLLDRTQLVSKLDQVREPQVSLTAHHYEHGIDERSGFPGGGHGRTKVVVAHAMVIPDGVPYPHVLLGDVETDADLMLLGHSHDGWVPAFVGGTVFCHPGSLLRVEATAVTLARAPKVLVVSAHPGKVFIEEVVVPHRPADEVFDVDARRLEKELERRMTDFTRAVESAQVQGATARARIERLAKEEGVGEEVGAMAIEYVTKAEESRGD